MVEDMKAVGIKCALLTGHPEILKRKDGSDADLKIYPSVPYRQESFVRRVVSWLQYFWQAFWWVFKFPASTPVLIFTNPAILPWLGTVLSVLRRQRFAVMVWDIYPDVIINEGRFRRSNPLIKLWLRFNRSAYERAEVVMTLGEFMSEEINRQFSPESTPAGEIKVVYPWADTDVIHPIPKADNPFASEHRQTDKITVMYSGKMGLTHDVETILAAAERLQDEPAIHFMFIGAGPKWNLVKTTIERNGLQNTTLLPWLREDLLKYSFAASDIFLVPILEKFERLMIPSRSMYALAAGSFVVAMVKDACDIGEWLDKYDCGEIIPAEDVDALESLLRRLSSDPSVFKSTREAARRTSERLFSRRKGTSDIIDILRKWLVQTN